MSTGATPLKPYESLRRNSSYIRLARAVTHSKAYQALSYRQRDLYRVCREQFNYKLKRKDSPTNDFPNIKEYKDEKVFYLTQEYIQKHEKGMYMGKKGCFDKKGFQNEMRILWKYGFIEILYKGGRGQGDKAVYKLCLMGDDWFLEQNKL